MKILIIGGCHTYGYGLTQGKSFVDLIVKSLEKEDLEVKVEYFAPFKMQKTLQLLKSMPNIFKNYDLIIFQMGHFELLSTECFLKLFSSKLNFNKKIYGKYDEQIDVQTKPTNIEEHRNFSPNFFPKKKSILHEIENKFKRHIKVEILRIMNLFGKVGRLTIVRELLAQILDWVSEFKNKIIILSPFPHTDKLQNFLRENGKNIFIEEGMKRNIKVFDAFSVIGSSEEYFIAMDDGHLNEISHQILSTYILDFYADELTKIKNLNLMFSEN